MREPSPIRLVYIEDYPSWSEQIPRLQDAQGSYYYLEYFNGKEWEPVPIKGEE